MRDPRSSESIVHSESLCLGSDRFVVFTTSITMEFIQLSSSRIMLSYVARLCMKVVTNSNYILTALIFFRVSWAS